MPEKTTERKVDIAALFTCTQCGHCCQGMTTVSLSIEDQEAQQHYLGFGLAQMKRDCWRITEQEVQMQVQQGACIFYQREQGCTIHPARPWQCRQWPLHPAILLYEENFSIIRRDCPGIKGDITYQRFCQLLSQFLLQGREKES